MTCVEVIGGYRCMVCGLETVYWSEYRGHKNDKGETCSGGIA